MSRPPRLIGRMWSAWDAGAPQEMQGPQASRIRSGSLTASGVARAAASLLARMAAARAACARSEHLGHSGGMGLLVRMRRLRIQYRPHSVQVLPPGSRKSGSGSRLNRGGGWWLIGLVRDAVWRGRRRQRARQRPRARVGRSGRASAQRRAGSGRAGSGCWCRRHDHHRRHRRRLPQHGSGRTTAGLHRTTRPAHHRQRQPAHHPYHRYPAHPHRRHLHPPRPPTPIDPPPTLRQPEAPACSSAVLNLGVGQGATEPRVRSGTPIAR